MDTILIIAIILGSLYIIWILPRIILMEIYHRKMEREYMEHETCEWIEDEEPA